MTYCVTALCHDTVTAAFSFNILMSTLNSSFENITVHELYTLILSFNIYVYVYSAY